jgi:hypothetical protein
MNLNIMILMLKDLIELLEKSTRESGSLGRHD